jgi:hypothetical protein
MRLHQEWFEFFVNCVALHIKHVKYRWTWLIAHKYYDILYSKQHMKPYFAQKMTHKWGHLEEVEHGLFLAWEIFSQILRDQMFSSPPKPK